MSSHFADVGSLYFSFFILALSLSSLGVFFHTQLKLGELLLPSLAMSLRFPNLLRYPLDGTPLPPSLSANKTLF